MDTKEIGKFIAELRKELNLTQQQLGDKIHIGREAVSKWERGLTIPDPSSLMILSMMFNVSVNELLTGERINPTNLEEINKAPIKIMTESEKRIRKLKIILGLVISLSIISFLVYYFVYNFNSFKAYVLSGSSKNFAMDQGLIVTSKNKSYMKFGEIRSHDNIPIDRVELYYKEDNKVETLLRTERLDTILVDLKGYRAFMDFSEMGETLTHLYIDIYYGDEQVDTIRVIASLDYKNDNLFPKFCKNISENYVDKKKVKMSDIPIFIRENFKLDKDRYSYKIKDDDNEYILEYDLGSSFIMAYDINDIMFNMRYTLDDKTIDISRLGKGATYDYLNKKCVSNSCDEHQKLIDLFYEKVFSKDI